MNHDIYNGTIPGYILPVEFRSQDCESWLEHAYGSSTMLLIQSILIDLFGGIICCVYISQFYRGIEITHPIFAILFNNVIFSTVLSFASFVTTCFMYAGILSCHSILTFLNTACSAAHFMNAISWVIIAILKQYLLSLKEDEDVDMARIRHLALGSNWCMLFGIVVIRVMLYVLTTYDMITPTIGPVAMVTLYLFHLITFGVVNYTTDSMLKEKLRRNLDEKGSDVTPMAQLNVQDLQDEREASSNPNVNVILNSSYKSRTKCFTNVLETGIDATEVYGGIYIGEDINDGGNDLTNVNVTSNKSPFTNPNRIYNSAVILPNQVPEQAENQTQNSNDRCETNILVSKNGSNIPSPRAPTAQFQNRTQHIDNEDLNRIEVVQEHFAHNPAASDRDTFSPPGPNDQMHNGRQDSNVETSHKDSKEHKSIIRAVVSYAMCIFVIIVALIFMTNFASKVNDSPIYVYMLILFSSCNKILRTLATFLMSIYCFERLRELYNQTIEQVKEYVVNIVN